MSTTQSTAMPGVTASPRLYHLMHSETIYWIMGAEELRMLFLLQPVPFWGVISNQFTHPEWNGFHFYDLIFPLLIYCRRSHSLLVGRNWRKQKQQVLWWVVKRAIHGS